MRDIALSIMHRAMGRGLYHSDVDSLLYSWNMKNEVEFHAIIDYKDGVKIKDRRITHQTIIVQSKLATKLEIPMFVVHYYLSTEAPIKMLYVIPINRIAKDIFVQLDKPLEGLWLSLKQYSRFIHYIRKEKNDEEAQKNLSNKYYEYPCPFHQDIK